MTTIDTSAPTSPQASTTAATLSAWSAAIVVTWGVMKAPSLELAQEVVSGTPGVGTFAPLVGLVTPGALQLAGFFLVLVALLLAYHKGRESGQAKEVNWWPTFVFFVVPMVAGTVHPLIAAAAVVFGAVLGYLPLGARKIPGYWHSDRPFLLGMWVVALVTGSVLAYGFAVV